MPLRRFSQTFNLDDLFLSAHGIIKTLIRREIQKVIRIYERNLNHKKFNAMLMLHFSTLPDELHNQKPDNTV